VSFLVLESADNVRLTVQHNASPEGFIMDRVLRKVEDLALLHDRIDAKIIREKNIKLGLRNQDGSGPVTASGGRTLWFQADLPPHDVPYRPSSCGRPLPH
jgi:hypothetical protein